MLDLVTATLDDNKAQDIVTIDLAGKSDIADYIVIATGTSGRQVAAMAEHLRTQLKQSGATNIAVEGLTQGDWVLVDAGDVVIHLFRGEVREFYNLEKMWGEAQPAAAAAKAHADAHTDTPAQV